MPLLKRTPERDRYSADSATVQDNCPQNRSKKVPQRVRQSALKDRKILEKIAAFRVPAHMLHEETSVAHQTPSDLSIDSSVTPSNDNIPVWALTGDVVKAVAATAALQIAAKPAYAFTFNLTQKARDKALTHPRGFLESLKRSFDKQLARAGVRLHYWFCIDRDWDGRLHIHGAFGAVTENEVLKEIMRRAWGVSPDKGRQFQIKIIPLRDDGWATYATRNLRRVSGTIGPAFTMTRPLQQDAQWTYCEIRRIMRGKRNGNGSHSE
ncbi:hypothetical protein GGD63_006143 [Bradyrhizobium sp. cir1]|uniref:hypothetical protein n=1 Tax=Bradyrhizobium sp. cir1 TaxID=1445730 RepID=UPI0016061043|nr:hypothetical protein [Bradyrhizobium sp. cir1]MBB4373321.1 hypothetical protein [Bradyrhizobium sp. cir1]